MKSQREWILLVGLLLAAGCGGRQDVTGTDWRTILRDEEVFSRQDLTVLKEHCGNLLRDDGGTDLGGYGVAWSEEEGVTAARLKKLHGQPSQIIEGEEAGHFVYYYGEVAFLFTKHRLNGVYMETRELVEEVAKVTEAIPTETDSE